MLHVCRLTTEQQFTTLADDWNRLAGDVPFRGFAWHAAWWKHYQHQSLGRELYVLVARDENQSVVGVAPWFVQPQTAHGRVIAWLGSGDVCSDYQTILSSEHHSDEVTEAFSDWLADSADEDHWDLLHLDSVHASDTATTQLVAQLENSGSTIHREAGPNCWRIALPSTWDDYVSTLSKSHRKQVRRFERRQLETGRATFHTVNTEAELQRGMQILVDLHQRRRESLGEPGCFASDAFGGFLHDVADELFHENRLRLAWVEIEGIPAAVEFQVAGANTTYAYQAGVNPDLLDDEPGRIINIATIRRAIEEGHQGFDFLRGDEPYKAHWRADPRETIIYRIAAQQTLAQVRHGLWVAGGSVKSLIKTGLELTGIR